MRNVDGNWALRGRDQEAIDVEIAGHRLEWGWSRCKGDSWGVGSVLWSTRGSMSNLGDHICPVLGVCQRLNHDCSWRSGFEGALGRWHGQREDFSTQIAPNSSLFLWMKLGLAEPTGFCCCMFIALEDTQPPPCNQLCRVSFRNTFTSGALSAEG